MKIEIRKSLITEIQEFIISNSLFKPKDKILVAVSGGIDSVVLCHLLHQSSYDFGIAHCNFQLREKESDSDEQFVKQLAEKLNVPYHVKRFDTSSYSKTNKISIQMAARDLRYAWFKEMRLENHYDVIAVAHHQDDEVETFFINLIRGTGIAGLHGIKTRVGNIARPLLFAGRKEIEAFAKENKIKYREDSSNKSVKYLRNRIRLQLIPMLKELNPQIEDSVRNDIKRIRYMEQVMLKVIDEKRQEIITTENDLVKLDIKKLLLLEDRSYFLFEFLRPYGFHGEIIEKILKSMNAKESKRFFSLTHRLVKDREFLFVSAITEKEPEQTFIITKNSKEFNKQLHLKFTKGNFELCFKPIKSYNFAVFDMDKLSFPLTIRKWKTGDTFHPFGMKGKKKLSDLFTDLKLSLIEKESVWLLCNNNDIIWVIGYRTDDRYKVTPATKKVYIAEIL